MAPTLQARQYTYCNGYQYSYGYDCGNSAWGSYGRWILLAAVIIGSFLLFLAFSCITARRRRRAGLNPYRGTAWTNGGWGGNTYQNNPQAYNRPAYGNNQYGSNPGAAAPPVYSPPKENTGYYGNGNGANQGYFGGQQSGIELQQPGNSYQPGRGGDELYAAPQGPPPSKQDGVIR